MLNWLVAVANKDDTVPAGQLALSKRTWLLATFQVGDSPYVQITADVLVVTEALQASRI